MTLATVPTRILSKREREVATLVHAGMENRAIGAQLGLRTQTIKNILVEVFNKTGMNSRTELALWVERGGLKT